MVNMSNFNHLMLLFLTVLIKSLATSNYKKTNKSIDGTIPVISHSPETGSTSNTSLPEEKLPQHMARERISTEKLLDNFKIAESTTKAEHLLKIQENSTVNEKKYVTGSEPDVLRHKNSTARASISTIDSTTKPPRVPTTMKAHKPLKTVHDDMPVSTGEKIHIITADNSYVDDSLNKTAKRADYIVPIIAVILSVPVVTIIISVLYKRSKDWWQHRNYRRMDYLIEGMYNS